MSWSLLPPLAYLVAFFLSAGETDAQGLQTDGHIRESIQVDRFYSEIFSVSPEEAPERSGLSKRAMFEIGGVALTGVGHLVFGESKLYIPLASLSWGGYIYYRARKEGDFLSEAGFTSKGLGTGFRDATFMALGATAVMTSIAARNRSLTLHPDMIPLLLLYPAWGLVQQFLVQGLVTRNLTKVEGWLGSSYVVTPISAALFGSVHLPNWKLTAGTFALGLAFTPLYLKHRNLWPLGLYHGWLGALFYSWVLERNPWQETIGRHPPKKIFPGFDVDAYGNPMLRLSVKF